MKVTVAMGGISSEREVSLKSGEGIFKNLDRNKYEVDKIVLDTKTDIIEKLPKDTDFVFLALHGKYGEDGQVQTILEAMDIPYSGCSPLTSAILMDKNYTKMILKSADLPTAPWTVVKSVDEINYDKIDELGYPVFIKPNSGGSSVATFKIKSREDVEDAVRAALEYDEIVMIEKFIKGDEYTSFVLDGEIYPIIRISSDNEFFDYEAKYSTDNGAKEEVVTLDEKLHSEIERISKGCWNVFNCRAYVRVDYIITDDGVPYVLELNTLPGMTETSLIPRSAKATGLEYKDLLDALIEASLDNK